MAISRCRLRALDRAGHGDYTYKAFDIADEYRMPVMILADGLLGQMMEPVELRDPIEKLPERPWACTGHNNEREHNVANSLYLTAEDLDRINHERFERYELIKEREQISEEFLCDDADIIVVAFGAAARIARNAVRAAREQGIKAGLFRPVTLWPFPSMRSRRPSAMPRATSRSR